MLPRPLRGCQARLLLLLQHHHCSKHLRWELQMESGKEILQRGICFLPKSFLGGQTLWFWWRSSPKLGVFSRKQTGRHNFAEGRRCRWQCCITACPCPQCPLQPPGHLALCWQHLPLAHRGDTARAALGSTWRNWLCKVRPFGPFPVDTRSTPSTAT